MGQRLKETLCKLETVQELDLQIFNIEKKKSELPTRLAPLDSEIIILKKQIEDKNKLLVESEKMKKQQRGALELNNERAKRSETRMNDIKTGNEFNALQKEIDSLKRNNEVIQESAKKTDDEINKINDEIAKIQAKLNEIEEKRNQEISATGSENDSFQTQLDGLQSKRKESVVGVENKILNAYDRIRVAKASMGLAIVTEGSCKACNIKIPPQLYNQLQRCEDLFTCPNCKRILFFKNGTSS